MELRIFNGCFPIIWIFFIFHRNNFYTILWGKKIKENAYWGEYADTLEWTLPNPPPEHTFETLPTREMWDKSKQH